MRLRVTIFVQKVIFHEAEEFLFLKQNVTVLLIINDRKTGPPTLTVTLPLVLLGILLLKNIFS